ncbi:hypothetical protein SADUNF_SadunfMtG0009100 (mitochondrion) [Salix dunnii]|uniref:Uncharacterized protein n=1 Tax=Salix dunnii TaxID=1413687 RepID=A0A835MBZ2_9ROSI|nr:hypothetical protein SADUNF_SadunfMtG0009100 [Salix dunnii]
MAERSPPFIPLFMALLICVSCHHCSPGLFLFCTSAFLILGSRPVLVSGLFYDFELPLRGGELGNRIELIRQSKKEENAIDIESIVTFSGSCYLKSIPAAVVNGRTPRASVRFWSSGLSLDLSVCCSCCPGERSNKWAISGRCLPFNVQD